MSRCIKINFAMQHPNDKVLADIQEHARACQLEGVIMATTPEAIKVITCGSSENIDLFLDKIDDLLAKNGDEVVIDTFLKDKDYRGVFRIMH